MQCKIHVLTETYIRERDITDTGASGRNSVKMNLEEVVSYGWYQNLLTVSDQHSRYLDRTVENTKTATIKKKKNDVIVVMSL